MRASLLALLLLSLPACRRETPAPPPPVPAAAPARTRVPAEPMSWLGADWLTREEREAEEQPEVMLDALGLKPGMRVADVGAGVGFHTVRLARRVAPGGHVWATDIQEEMVSRLRSNVEAAGLNNVTPVLTKPDETGLPDGQLDLVLMVDVFHELAEPERMLAKLRRALAPGGRVALVEFRAEDPNVPIKQEHKMSVAQVDAELEAAGFRRVQRFDGLPWQHLLVYSLASTDGGPSGRPLQ
ncbi:class I SAM-dependent methyltransferase [Pyxidicoccus fallax]|uniref:Class I SAM-dependent methyltransferase n=1 Tax=Pyxidicoccus fallax TaxID=394095 RepID=A0A848LCP4_9BACT|nr:class I SAM-dependent methyltransferase [Pyxidicoccus fallax]NMO16749.1 class I SAM-dependent methyltransferase [Pyxidicoccus fallax]NPC77858.1 class I SAM-dependent methyltransferase [Pyxidicoccus fallax]